MEDFVWTLGALCSCKMRAEIGKHKIENFKRNFSVNDFDINNNDQIYIPPRQHDKNFRRMTFNRKILENKKFCLQHKCHVEYSSRERKCININMAKLIDSLVISYGFNFTNKQNPENVIRSLQEASPIVI